MSNKDTDIAELDFLSLIGTVNSKRCNCSNLSGRWIFIYVFRKLINVINKPVSKSLVGGTLDVMVNVYTSS